MGFRALSVPPKSAHTKGCHCEQCTALQPPLFPSGFLGAHTSPRLAQPSFRTALASAPRRAAGGHWAGRRYTLDVPLRDAGLRDRCLRSPGSSGTVLRGILHSRPEGPAWMSPSHPQSVDSSVHPVLFSPLPHFHFLRSPPPITTCTNALSQENPNQTGLCLRLLAALLRHVLGTQHVLSTSQY